MGTRTTLTVTVRPFRRRARVLQWMTRRPLYWRCRSSRRYDYPDVGGPFRFLSPNPRKDCAMFRLVWAASARTHGILSYAPTNLLIAVTRARRGLKWGIPAMLAAIPYFLAAQWCVTTIENGGPGWLNLLVLLCGWNSIKLVLNGPITAILLGRARLRELRKRRREPARSGSPSRGCQPRHWASTPRSSSRQACARRELPAPQLARP